VAGKTQIDVDVNSAEFQAFTDKFAKYAALLATVPDLWKKAGQSAGVVKTKFEETAASTGVVAGSMAAIHGSAKDFHQITISTTRYWKELSLTTGGVAKNIVAATESLLKWSGILGLVTGGAGLFGFDRLAHSVASQRTAALSTGGDYGARASFLTNMRSVVGDPEGLLSTISEAQANQGRDLITLGLTREQIKGDPADVAIAAWRRMSKIAKADRLENLDTDPHLKMFTHEQRMMGRDLSEEQIEKKIAQFQEERKANKYGLSPEALKAYTDFTTQMESASRSIEKIFVEGLVRLADPLRNLSKEVVKLVAMLMSKDGPLDALIGDLAEGIKWLAGEIDKKEFREDVNSFFEEVGRLASSLGGLLTGLLKFANWLGVDTSGMFGGGVSAVVGKSDSSGFSSAPGLSLHGGGKDVGDGGGDAKPGALGHHGAGRSDLGGGGSGINKQNTEAAQDAMNYLIKEKGFTPEGAATAVGQILTEDPSFALASSGVGGDKNLGPGKEAHGLFQWREGRNTALKNYLSEHGGDTVHHELDFYSEEIKTHKGSGGSEAGWRQTHSIEEGNRYGYSFEGYAGGIQKRREQDSRRMLESYNKSATDKPKVTIRNNPGGNTVDAANAAAAGSP